MMLHKLLPLVVTLLVSSASGIRAPDDDVTNGTDPYVINGTVIYYFGGNSGSNDTITIDDPDVMNGTVIYYFGGNLTWGGCEEISEMVNGTNVTYTICAAAGGGGGWPCGIVGNNNSEICENFPTAESGAGLVYLEELLSELENPLALDSDMADILETALEDCSSAARAHGQFVKCMKKVLDTLADDLTIREIKLLKRAVVASDFGKPASTILEEEAGITIPKLVKASLKKCNGAKSLKKYKRCVRLRVNKFVKTKKLTPRQGKKIKRAARKSEDLAQEIENGW